MTQGLRELDLYSFCKHSFDMKKHDGRRIPVASGTVVSVIYRGGDSKIESRAPRDGWIWPRDSQAPDDIVQYMID